MKRFILGLIIAASLAPAAPSHAGGYGPDHGYRYRTTYDKWDSGFSGYYSYHESCTRSYSGYGVYSTCYDSTYFTPSTYVYVEELQMSGGYHRVRVFKNQDDSDAYVTYYIYESGSTRRVDYREFYGDSYFRTVYTTTYYVEQRTVVWDQLHWDQGFEKVMVGTFAMDIGAIVADTSGGNKTADEIGIGLFLLGSSSYVAGKMEMAQSGLEEYVVREHITQGIDVR